MLSVRLAELGGRSGPVLAFAAHMKDFRKLQIILFAAHDFQ